MLSVHPSDAGNSNQELHIFTQNVCGDRDHSGRSHRGPVHQRASQNLPQLCQTLQGQEVQHESVPHGAAQLYSADGRPHGDGQGRGVNLSGALRQPG
jgi:hypothetical protein